MWSNSIAENHAVQTNSVQPGSDRLGLVVGMFAITTSWQDENRRAWSVIPRRRVLGDQRGSHDWHKSPST